MKTNIYKGSFLNYNNENKFDIIIGNPPFQHQHKKDNKNINTNLWTLFVGLTFDDFLKENGFLLFITPYSWMSFTFKYPHIFYDNYILLFFFIFYN